jgi:hypothetical protein
MQKDTINHENPAIGNVLLALVALCRLCAVGKLRIAAVMLVRWQVCKAVVLINLNF